MDGKIQPFKESRQVLDNPAMLFGVFHNASLAHLPFAYFELRLYQSCNH